jgi:hypothetical protein
MFPQKRLPIVQREIIEQCPIDINDKFKQSLVEMVMPLKALQQRFRSSFDDWTMCYSVGP